MTNPNPTQDSEEQLDDILAELTREAAINNETNGKNLIKAVSKGVFVDEGLRERAKSKILAWRDQEVVKARIDELKRNRTYRKDAVRGYEYNDGYWDAMDQVGKADEQRVIELSERLRKEEQINE